MLQLLRPGTHGNTHIHNQLGEQDKEAEEGGRGRMQANTIQDGGSFVLSRQIEKHLSVVLSEVKYEFYVA